MFTIKINCVRIGIANRKYKNIALYFFLFRFRYMKEILMERLTHRKNVISRRKFINEQNFR